MQAGKLRHRVELHSASTDRSDYGEQTETWSKYDTVWASIEPLQGRELMHAQQISAEITHLARMRYNSSAATEHRVIFGARTLEIISIINPEERNREMVLMCKEVT